MIHTVSTPSDITNTFSTASGQTFYVKTTASGSNSSITATSCTIKYTTVYGLTNSYGNTYSTDITFTVNASNYSTWSTSYATAVATEQNKIKNLDTYKMLNVALPSVETNTSYVATNGVTYQYKVTATNGTASLTERKIVYTSTWGIGNYNNTWGTTHTLTLTTSNYSTANITTTYRTTQVTATQNYLNTLIGTFSTPSQFTETYVNSPSGLTYYIKTTYSGSNTSITATSGTLTATTAWGTTSGTYDHSFTDGNTSSVSITPSNFQNRDTLITNIGSTQRVNLKNYLDTLIGVVVTPSDSTTSFATNSGQTFYVKTTFSGGNTSVTATGTTIKYTTVYGLSTSYGNTLSTDVEFVVTPDNYATWESEIASAVSTEQNKVKDLATYKMLNVALPSVVTNTSYVATNGITYQYKVTATNGTCDLTQHNIIYTTTWGIGNYNNTYSSKTTLKLTTSNYTTANITTTYRTTQVTATQNYLNTLIYTVSTPSVVTNTFSTASGKTFYVKTTASGSNSSITATSCTIKYTTVYGLTNSYGTTYSTDVTFTVTPSNYSSWSTSYATAVSTEQDKIKNLDSYKMLNVSLPSNHSDSYTAANGLTYAYSSTYTQGTADLTQNNITCTTTYTRQDATVKTYNTVTTKLTTSNYSNATTTLSSVLSTQEQALKDYLDTLLVMPDPYTNTYTKSGFMYYFEIYYTVPDEESHEVTATAKIDLITLKSTTVTCTDMDDFNTQKTILEATKISEMQAAVAGGPSNSTVSYGGFAIKTTYSKKAVTASTVNGSVYCTLYLEGFLVHGTLNLGKLTSFTNYKFVYTTIINTITNKVAEIKTQIDKLPTSGSYTYQPSENFGTSIVYTYSRVKLLYTLSVSIDGLQVESATQYLRIYEIERLKAKMDYLLSKCQSKIKNVMPKDVEVTYNGITISKKFTKSVSSDTVTCKLYVDDVLKGTYTSTFDLTNELLKQDLQELGDGDFAEYKSNAQSMNITVTSSTNITSGGKTYNVSILTEKVGDKIRVFRVIGNMKTNYIDVDINYLNASTTKTAIQTAANKLLANLNTLINFYRPPSEAALVELLKVSTL